VRLQKASSIVPRLVTSCGQLRSPSGLVPFGLLVDEVSAASRQSRKRDRFTVGRHLGRSGPRSSSRKSGRSGPRPRMCPRERRIEGPRAPTLHRVGLVWWDRRVSLPHGRGAWVASASPRRCRGRPGNAGVSSHRCSGLTTRGVRVDRVGVELAPERSQERERGSAGRGFGPVRPLARETSAGSCRRAGAGPRSRSTRRTALPVLGAGTRSSGEASAAPCDVDPRRQGADGLRLLRRRADAGERGERSARAHAPRAFVPGAGIRRSAVVLADRVGCRSRRAALGPGRKAMGLARWLPAHAGELSGRKRAGSRVAAAKAAGTRAATPVAGSS